MKKVFLLSLMTAAMVVVFNSCQKEDSIATGLKNSGRISEKAPVAMAVPTTDFTSKQIDPPSCYNGHGCSSMVPYPSSKRSRLKWNISYPSSGTFYYRLYKKAGSSGDYNKVDEFSCTKTSGMWYAGNALTNSSTFIFLLSRTSMSSFPATIREDSYGLLTTTSGTYLDSGYNDHWKFTTGTATGNCITVDSARVTKE